MSNFKLKCRKCNSVIEVSGKEANAECGCGNCALSIKNNRLNISSQGGVGDYIIIKDDEEYILVSKKELEGNNG